MGRVSKALLTSSFTFFLISIEAVAVRTNLIQNEKELINLSNLCNFQLFGSNSEGIISDQKLLCSFNIQIFYSIWSVR